MSTRNLCERISAYLLESGTDPIDKVLPRHGGTGADWFGQAWHVKGHSAPSNVGDSGHFIHMEGTDGGGEHELIHREVVPGEQYQDTVVASGSRRKVVNAALDMAGKSHLKTSGPAYIVLQGHRANDFFAAHREAGHGHVAPEHMGNTLEDHINAHIPYHINHGEWKAEMVKTTQHPSDLDNGSVHIRVHPTDEHKNESLDAYKLKNHIEHLKGLIASAPHEDKVKLREIMKSKQAALKKSLK